MVTVTVAVTDTNVVAVVVATFHTIGHAIRVRVTVKTRVRMIVPRPGDTGGDLGTPARSRPPFDVGSWGGGYGE